MRLSSYFVPSEYQSATEAKQRFADWMQRNYPDIYQAATAEFIGLGEIPPAAQPTMIDRVFENLGKFGTAYAQYKGQRDIIKINIERAKKGLDPINAGDVAPQANVGIAKDTRNMIYFGIGAVVLALLFSGRRAR